MASRVLTHYLNSFRGFSREVWLLSGVMLINRSGTMVIPFMTVYLTQVMGYSLGQAGWVMSAFGAGSVLGSFLGGKLTDRIGFYQVQFWSLLLSGLAFIGLGYAGNIWAFGAMVFVVSTLADAFRPANFAALATYSRPENRTRAMGLLRLAVNLGWAVGPAVGGLLAASVGYKALFWVDGLTCISAAIFFRLALPVRERPREERESSGEGLVLASSSAYRDGKYLIFLLLVLLNGIAFMQLFSTMPVFFKQEIFLDEGQIGRLMAVNGLVIALVEMPLIYLVEHRFGKWQIVSIGTLLIGFSYLLFNIFGAFWGVAFACMMLMTVGEMLSLPFIATMALDFTNDKNRGQYMALFTMTYSVSHIISPNLGLQVAEHFGFSSLWYLLMFFCVLVWFGFRRMAAIARRPAVEPAPALTGPGD
ncbi:MAG: MFS transporter [Phaeodactylibacter sp.]|nr:MFS transporter [Phaeodactylibacter sp.]MCB9299410.1 MFS transporter [Lewinellaceae bacterium]